MNIQFRLTQEMKATKLEDIGLDARVTNIVNRYGFLTVEDAVTNLKKIKIFRGIGEKKMKLLVNAIVDYMIQNLPEKELIEWFKYLIENNSAEELRSIIEGFNKVTETAA